MSLRTRLFLDLPFDRGNLICLQGEQAHYISNVLRFRKGEALRVFNGKDGEWQAEVSSIAKTKAELELKEQVRMQIKEKKLHLAFCPVKAVNASFIVQKATELGVTDIWPVISKRTIVKSVNIAKLHKSVIEAAEQSERLSIPNVNEAIPLREFIKLKPFCGSVMFCYELGNGLNYSDLQSTLKGDNDCILVGPEGGFTSDEAIYLSSFSFSIAANFGIRIMRAETAAIAAISAYNTIMNNWSIG